MHERHMYGKESSQPVLEARSTTPPFIIYKYQMCLKDIILLYSLVIYCLDYVCSNKTSQSFLWQPDADSSCHSHRFYNKSMCGKECLVCGNSLIRETC